MNALRAEKVTEPWEPRSCTSCIPPLLGLGPNAVKQAYPRRNKPHATCLPIFSIGLTQSTSQFLSGLPLRAKKEKEKRREERDI